MDGRPWDTFGHFWPSSNEAKRGQGGSPGVPNDRWVQNHKWASLSLFRPKDHKPPEWPGPPRTPAMASDSHQRVPATFHEGYQLKIRDNLGPDQ
ncbi:hypothetical protein O181_092577 [Austropuccinia psidii MF-1]|uniref:Uncharacterized protein n=1 Tax=Austropuccinia psidii MF-1 TaxID=1389203 RepID=A0A9Q3P9P7_9BASI|nr:hypothetical protein [Austropuccinia psidii MF-1]